MFQRRDLVTAEVKKHLSLPQNTWSKLNYYYKLRCKLVHERVSAAIPDRDIEEYPTEFTAPLNHVRLALAPHRR